MSRFDAIAERIASDQLMVHEGYTFDERFTRKLQRVWDKLGIEAEHIGYADDDEVEVRLEGTEDALIEFLKGAGYSRSEAKRELKRASRVAGDEWADAETEAFVKDLAKVMKSDRHVGKAQARGNEIHFTFFPTLFAEIPLVLTVREFGYGGKSESLNGDFSSRENASFRLPGGFTRDRDPREMWKRGKDMLVDIFQRAMAR